MARFALKKTFGAHIRWELFITALLRQFSTFTERAIQPTLSECGRWSFWRNSLVYCTRSKRFHNLGSLNSSRPNHRSLPNRSIFQCGACA